MDDRQIDAFILFNEHEEGVEPIVHDLEKRGIATYFWRRDIPAGESWESIEDDRLSEAQSVLVFLGEKDWGPNHRSLAEKAVAMQKRLIPVLIGKPSPEAFEQVGGLFRRLRYVEFRSAGDPAALDLLARSIRRSEVSGAWVSRIDAIIGTIRDGNESERADVLGQIRISQTLDREALSARLRTEINDRFGPGAETGDFAAAIRDPKRIASIRSWLLSCLIWTDRENPQNRDLILRHIAGSSSNSTDTTEPDRNVRFWALSQLYVTRASYAQAAAEQALSDEAPEVSSLARAITGAPGLIEDFRSALASESFETVWPVLRTIRIVAVPDLSREVCAQLERSVLGTSLAYDALYALSNPLMARAAAPLFQQKPGTAGMVGRVIAEAASSDPSALRAFASVLAVLPEQEVRAALDVAMADPAQRDRARLLREFLRDYRRGGDGTQTVLVAGYASDTIDVRQDRLDIREDVQTLAAVMLAKTVTPPLAIGLFGDWGSGKSFFMQSLRRVTEDLAGSRSDAFCTNIVSIQFNAWHYADTNLWASLVSYILEQLAAYINPQPTVEEQQSALVAQLGSARALVEEAETERRRVQELIRSRADELQKAQTEREQREIRLRDLRAFDFQTLIRDHPEIEKRVRTALDEMGVPAVLASAEDLASLVAETRTVGARMTALFTAVFQSKNRVITWVLLAVVLLIIPGAAYLLSTQHVNDFFVRVGVVAAQIITIAAGAKKILAGALEKVKKNLTTVEQAKREVDKLLADKRAVLSNEEKHLQQDIAALRAQEQQSEARLAESAGRVAELEERIRTAKQGLSLAQFLSERTRSDDYRRYLGLVSTIRRDFEALGTRLSEAVDGDPVRQVDRIVLYIDDLDRCPEEKVMDVLQAVHLLLAYPLFVVVVGVDPRWLLYSLKSTYRAFGRTAETGSPVDDEWQTTPQNYLEKIFQIPFGLRPMTPDGFSRLIGSLLAPREGATQEIQPDAPGRQIRGDSGPTRDVGNEQQRTEPKGGRPSLPPDPAAPLPNWEAEAEFIVHEEALAITLWEAGYAERLFALIPTPRAAKRFSNVYRILKAPVQRQQLRAFEGTRELLGEFQVPMLLLAILIGAPAEALVLFPALSKAAMARQNMQEALQNFPGLAGVPSGKLGDLQERIWPIVNDPGFPASPELLTTWLPRVARFSFDVGRTVHPGRDGDMR